MNLYLLFFFQSFYRFCDCSSCSISCLELLYLCFCEWLFMMLSSGGDMISISHRDYFIVLYVFYFSAEFLYFSNDIFVPAFDIFYIHDGRLSSSNHSCKDHSYSGSEIPRRYYGAFEVCFSEYERLMRIHDGNMSSHLLDFYEPIETSLKENLMDS